MKKDKVALITGSAKRVGACLAKHLHEKGMRIVIHYHRSSPEAQSLCQYLNHQRPQSAIAIHTNLEETHSIPKLVSHTISTWGRLDVLINNAATFEPSSLDSFSLKEWHHAMHSNLTAPFILSVEAAPHLQKTQGCIINMLDIRANRPLKKYVPYCISKAGLKMVTKSLALEWAPDIRVNGIAPGVVLWPDEATPIQEKLHQSILARTPLKRAGAPEDIAQASYFLIEKAPYITGQVITIDGGRSLV